MREQVANRLTALRRAADFSTKFGMRTPILLAPMAGVPSTALSIAVSRAGGMGACGILLMTPSEILAWSNEVRTQSPGPFQLNNWVPDPPPLRDQSHESEVRRFLSAWGPLPSPTAADSGVLDFEAQSHALLEARPDVASSVMGLFPQWLVSRLRTSGIAWFATVTTVAEARAAQDAGADAIIAQGAEAGGHRGTFDARLGEATQVGSFALIPAVARAVSLPVIAAGGIADATGIAAALILGASAVQIGTGFLRCPEARIHPASADALARTSPEQTRVSRVFSGRAGRSVATRYVQAATAADAPAPAPYPVQRGLTAAMRKDALEKGNVERMQAWCGQSAAMARNDAAFDVASELWEEAKAILG